MGYNYEGKYSEQRLVQSDPISMETDKDHVLIARIKKDHGRKQINI
jgi:hypothetical protein